ncbi:uncharacterized protein [Palaemon carinicauda]|uniref:uncharacterized protein isoform X1 n=1 Tax=Palaemon carinicauda TaxID=392227 RepID=UPI0035B6A9FD
MVSTCCVPSCKNKRIKQGNHQIVRFYRIPKFNLERRAKWIKAIGRGADWKPTAFSRVCSDHFVLGEKSDNKLSPNFVPCIFSHTTVSEKRKLLRQFDIHNREVAETTKKINTATSMLSIVKEELINCGIKAGGKTCSEFIGDSDNDTEDLDLKPAVLYVGGQFVDPRRQLDSERGILSSVEIEKILTNYSKKIRLLKNEKGTQTLLPHDYIKSLEQECSNLRSEMSYFRGKYVFKNITIEKLVDADDKVRYLTGLESYRMLKVLNDTVECYQSEMFKMTGFQQLLMTLMKMRLGLTIPFLAILFDVEAAAVEKLFICTVELLFSKVVPRMITWPNTSEMKKVIPEEFIDCENCLYVVDCFEISVIGTTDDAAFQNDDSDSLNRCGSDRALCIRRYFTAMAPQGSIIFISKGRDKDVKYRTLIIESGFLVNIAVGDALITERELNIEDEIDVRGASVKMSSNVKSKGASEIEDGSRGLVRIKWVVHSLKQKFQILDGEIPLKWMDSIDSGCYTTLDKIVHISCALLNMTNKIWTFDRFL